MKAKIKESHTYPDRGCGGAIIVDSYSCCLKGGAQFNSVLKFRAPKLPALPPWLSICPNWAAILVVYHPYTFFGGRVRLRPRRT